KGAAPALNDLLGGQIPVMFDSLPGVIQHLKSGKLRALGVTTARRVASMPEIPTIDEAGVPGFEATAWFGLYGPANLPPEVLDRSAADVRAVLQSERTRERFAPQGAEVISMTQPEFARFVAAEIDKWARVVDRAGLKPQ